MPAYDVHALRRLVKARDKHLAVEKPFNEAVKYIKEHYGTDKDSAADYVMYLRGTRQSAGATTKSNPVDRRHSRFDESRGEWVQVPDDEEGSP